MSPRWIQKVVSMLTCLIASSVFAGSLPTDANPSFAAPAVIVPLEPTLRNSSPADCPQPGRVKGLYRIDDDLNPFVTKDRRTLPNDNLISAFGEKEIEEIRRKEEAQSGENYGKCGVGKCGVSAGNESSCVCRCETKGFNHSIYWSEFTTVDLSPDPPLDAYSFSKTDISESPSGPDQVYFVVSISMDKSNSWVVRDSKKADLLSHEQGHYDIRALGARQFCLYCKGLELPDCNSVREEMKNHYDDIKSKRKSTNSKYDKQTSHGSSEAAQRKWKVHIQNAKQNPNGTLHDLPR